MCPKPVAHITEADLMRADLKHANLWHVSLRAAYAGGPDYLLLFLQAKSIAQRVQ